MIYRVFVRHKKGFADHRGAALKNEWKAAGLPAVKHIQTGHAYEVCGDLSEADVRTLSGQLLADPVTQDYFVCEKDQKKSIGNDRDHSLQAQVWLKSGVSDPVADTVRLAAHDLDLPEFDQARSGSFFKFFGAPAPKEVKAFCENYLMNTLIQKLEIVG